MPRIDPTPCPDCISEHQDCAACETCGGTGVVETEDGDPNDIDYECDRLRDRLFDEGRRV